MYFDDFLLTIWQTIKPFIRMFIFIIVFLIRAFLRSQVPGIDCCRANKQASVLEQNNNCSNDLRQWKATSLQAFKAWLKRRRCIINNMCT